MVELVGKIELMGPGFLVVNIIVNYCCKGVLQYAEMLKELKIKKQVFFVTFFLLMAFRLGGGPGPIGPPALATPIIVTSILFVILRFCVLFCLFGLVCMSKRH